jgi:hypothetical protein
MKRFDHDWKSATERELERLIEPLASYISAADRPRVVLTSALAGLSRAVEETNRAANWHISTFLQNQGSSGVELARRPATI